MSQVETLRHEMHDLIEQIDNEKFLVQLREVITLATTPHDSNLWDDLTHQEQSEIRQALEETKDPAKCLSNDEVIKKHAPWRVK
jgi:hypothetical protein